MIEITRDYARFIFALENTATSEGYVCSNDGDLTNIGIDLMKELIKEYPDIAAKYPMLDWVEKFNDNS